MGPEWILFIGVGLYGLCVFAAIVCGVWFDGPKGMP